MKNSKTWFRSFVSTLFFLVSFPTFYCPEQALAYNQAHIKYGSEPKQTMDIYTPEGGEQLAHPVLIYVHGGGWMHGDKSNVSEKPTFFTNKGYVFVSVNYQLSPRVPYTDMAKDVANTIHWVYHRADQYKIDRAKINLMGHSAGGHLVTLVGTNPYYLASAGLPLQVINTVVNLDGPVDLTEFIPRNTTYMEVFGGKQETWADASPITYAANKHLPSILLVGKDQKAFTTFAEKARYAGNTVELFFNHTLTHREITKLLGAGSDNAEAINMTNAVAGFLDKNNSW
ncbi:alpha/beta hydrolase [Neobacillus dielmonensis]|uniref:alpha/beta hydrolase n=1 Tax=Neobacillus dielmonensis TaxID=1347369 RepID=UPI00069451A5|nr:alpha/beta hydrolase [Neobacillus dielmonensis]